VLHELLVGKPPFHGETVPEICATVLTQEPPRLTSIRASVPPPVENAVLRCLEKDPEARLASAAELARAIAPFGTSVARTSCARIERLLEGGGVVSDLSLLPPMAEERTPSLSDWPSDPYAPGDPYAERMRGASSMRVILGSVLLLGALGVAALMVMYASVHENEPREGVTAMQPAPVSTATMAARATATAAVPATATATETGTATAPETASAAAPATASVQAVATATAKPVQVPVHRPAALPAPRQTPKAAPRPHGAPHSSLPASEEDVFDGRK
jgi:eukaryotic-like serine/threonine-protein kinase